MILYKKTATHLVSARTKSGYFKLQDGVDRHLGEVLVVRLTLPAAAALGQADEAMPEEKSGDSHGRADHKDRNQGHDVLLGPMHKNQGH